MARKANKVQEISLPFVGFLPRNEPLDAQPVYIAGKSDQELLSIALEDDRAAAIIMATFKSIAEATSLNVQDFIRRTGLDAEVHLKLRVARELAARFAAEKLRDRPVISTFNSVVEYLRIRMATEYSEQVRVLFLDTKNRLICDEVVGYGTIDHAPVYIRELFFRAMQLGAKSMILSHNHPGGDANPSSGDIALTKAVVEAGKALEIAVHDHIIVGADNTFSFKGNGLI